MGYLKFTITYDISFDGGTQWTNKVMIVKNCDDKIDAECKLSKFLQKKYERVQTIRIIKCMGDVSDDSKTNMFGGYDKGIDDNLFKQFGDIFGNNNLFKTKKIND